MSNTKKGNKIFEMEVIENDDTIEFKVTSKYPLEEEVFEDLKDIVHEIVDNKELYD